jgi:hypothetical protein
MKLLLQLLALMVLMISMSHCRSAKKIQTAITKKDTAQIVPVNDGRADSLRFINQVYNGIQHNRIDYKTFSAKVKVGFVDKDGKRNDFNAFVRMWKDSVLWVSINAALGIEAFRIMVTPDSVKVLNKLDKELQLRSVNYLQEVAHIPLDFHSLQDLLVGNPVYLDTNITSYKKEEDGDISLVSMGPDFKNLVTVSNPSFVIKNSKLDDRDVLRARSCLITYGNYEERDGLRFSTFRKITVTEKNKLDIELQYKQYSFNEDLSFPFGIPKNYKIK